MDILIRSEKSADIDAIEQVTLAAFTGQVQRQPNGAFDRQRSCVMQARCRFHWWQKLTKKLSDMWLSRL